MNNQTRKEIIEIVELKIDRSMTELDQKRLAELIRDDAEAKAFYVEQCHLHAMLAWQHGVLPDVAFSGDGSTATSTTLATDQQRRWRVSTGLIGFALACSVLWILVGAFQRHQDEASRFVDSDAITVTPLVAWEERPIVGRVVRTVATDLTTDVSNVSCRPGDMIRTGSYEMKQGLIEIYLDCGVEMIVQSPARFEVLDAMAMFMHQGSLSAKVGPGAEGFVVDTPSVNVIDHGTEFGINVHADKTSEVHVFSGKVDVNPVNAPPDTTGVHLQTDEATRVDGRGVIPQGINVARDQFLRSLDETGIAETIFSESVEALEPNIYLRMGVPNEGYQLHGVGKNASTGTIEPGSMIGPPFAPGRIGGAIRFDGPQTQSFAWIDDYPIARDNQLTVAAWVKAESRPRWAAIAKHWAVELIEEGPANTGIGGQFHFGLHEDAGDLEVQVRDRAGIIVKLREKVPMALQTWHYVAFVADGETLTLYRNGEVVASAPCDGLAADGPNRLGIGAKLSPDGSMPDDRNPGYWHGLIDEVAVFDRALTPDELKDLYRKSAIKP